MERKEKHGGLRSFGNLKYLNEKGFLHQKWDNRVYPPFYNKAAINELQKFWHTDENDIFITTHQKVGTHLTKRFVSEILRRCYPYKADNGIFSGDIGHHTIPWPEVLVSQYGLDAFKTFLEKTAGMPRVWYLHCSGQDLPFKKLHKDSRFIFVFRDPRGTCESQFHFYKSHPMLGVDESITMEDFVDIFLDGKLYFGDYYKHTLHWINGCEGKIDPRQLLIMRYENLVEEKLPSAQLLNNFIYPHKILSINDLNNVVSSTDFNKMKKEISENPQSFHFNPKTFFRAGKTYGWQEKLSKEIIEKINIKTEKVWGKGNLSSPQIENTLTLKSNLYGINS